MPSAELFLEEHLNENGLYVVSQGEGKPSSIRDQIRKATRLMAHANTLGRIKRSEVLLILGAGAAGVSAAWKAVTAGINVVLLELEDRPFSAQAKCQTRWLHPNEYLWPHPVCDQPNYPLLAEAEAAPPMLAWHADLPSRVASHWRDQFAEWASQHEQENYPNGYLDFQPNMRPGYPDPQALQALARQALQRGACQMVLLCVGAKEREVAGSQHRSYRFWESDPYGAFRYGHPSVAPEGCRTLVSGGGDGALQDFLRIACQREGVTEPVHMFELLNPLLSTLERCSAYRPLQAVFQAWDETRHRPEPRELWSWLEIFVQRLNETPEAAAIALQIDGMIDPELAAGHKVLHLNLAESRFETCFALNALLVRLFDWYLRQRRQETVFQPNAFIRAVNNASVDHHCSGDPGSGAAGCLLKPHRVAFHPLPGGNTVPERTYDVTVIRHGIQPLAQAHP